MNLNNIIQLDLNRSELAIEAVKILTNDEIKELISLYKDQVYNRFTVGHYVDLFGFRLVVVNQYQISHKKEFCIFKGVRRYFKGKCNVKKIASIALRLIIYHIRKK